MKRVAVSLVVGLILIAPGTAIAKMPWHEVEVQPAAPVAGEPLTIIVRFYDDAALTRPSESWPEHGGGRLELESDAGRVSLDPTETAVGTFRAEVTLSEGTWRLVAIQQFSGASGPDDVELATVSVAPAPSATGPISAAIGVAVVTVGAVWVRRRTR
jgi:hypothetical protein